MTTKTVRIHLKKNGSLEKYGYHVKDTRDTRRRALNKAVADKKSRAAFNQLIQRLNVLSIYFKHTFPLYAARAVEDENYVRKKRDITFPLA